MKINRKALVLAALALAPILGPGAAIAHPGHELSGLGAGLIHPFLGLDHLLAMTAVGVWAALQPAHRAWQAPALFVAMAAAGAGIGLAGAGLPLVEPGIAASVVLMGLLIAGAARVPASASLALIGGFAVLHGQAHAAEAVAPLGGYVAGFLAASAALHAGGYVTGRMLSATRYGVSVAGFLITAAGAALALG